MKRYDKEFFDNAGFSERYEYVKIPSKVFTILRPKVGDDVLLCYHYKKKDGGYTTMLNYVNKKDGILVNKGGYCFDLDPKESFDDRVILVAEEIAESWTKYAVKHRNPAEYEINRIIRRGNVFDIGDELECCDGYTYRIVEAHEDETGDVPCSTQERECAFYHVCKKGCKIANLINNGRMLVRIKDGVELNSNII